MSPKVYCHFDLHCFCYERLQIRRHLKTLRSVDDPYLTMFRSLTNFILGNASDEHSSLIEFADVSFYKHNKSTGENTLIYPKTTLSLNSSPKQTPKYSLQVFSNSKDSISVAITESFFMQLDAEMNLLFGQSDAETCWFAKFNTCPSDPTIQTFKLLLSECIFETTFKKPHGEASQEQLDKIMQEMSTYVKSPLSLETIPLGEEVFKSTGDCSLYTFDKNRKTFVPKSAEVTVVLHKLAISKYGSFGYAMHIGNQSGRLHSQYIQPDISEHVDKGSCSFVWCFWDEQQQQHGEDVQTLCLRWDSVDNLIEFSKAFGQCLWEIKNKEAFYKLKKEDSDYLLYSYTHPMDIESSESESESSISESDNYSDARSEMKIYSVSTNDDRSDSKNQHLAIGYRNNRTFVSRGKSIGVFKSSNETSDYATMDDDLEFVTTIKSVQSVDGTPFSPDQLLLHNQDSSLLLRSSYLDPTKIYRMDLERGKVVDEWVAHPDTKMTSILSSRKNAQLTPEQTLIGISANSIFRIDPRLSGNKVVEEEQKQYVVKSNFSCGVTTSVGELAVASEKGEIRLYDKLDKRAKSLIPGFGDPIIGIDVVENGKFIVATCQTYLLLINTELESASSTRATAFTKSDAKHRRPPIRLQLRPEHVAYMGNKVSFTPAHFNCDLESPGDDLKDRSIVTSTGPFVIIWSLDKVVRLGKLFDYQIRKYSDNVVADNFRFIGQDDSILVTLPHHVTVVDKDSLMKPTPRAFMRETE